MDTASDLVKTVKDLVGQGYVHEFRIKDGLLHDLASDTPVNTDMIRVDTALRFESEPAAGDGSNLYAVTDTKTGNKGLLIDAFDTLDTTCAKELFDHLNTERKAIHEEHDDPNIRYGLRKIYKADFDQDPERYVLRIAFPDFPSCPFGESFSVLGFDTANQEYVWLVTSIMRDARLARVPFQGEDAQNG